jgi:hypothetical protein
MISLHTLERYRIRGSAVVSLWGWEGDDTCGAFEIPSPIDHATLVVIVSSDGGWEHVSVSRKNRTPNWPEMAYIYRLFFREDETAMQLHVPPSEHVNMMPNCLHLWRPINAAIPKPPSIFVGLGSEPARNRAEALERMKQIAAAREQ